MITAATSLARARDWSARAERAPQGEFRERLERIARSWAALAAMTDRGAGEMRGRGCFAAQKRD
jgi:hypothetical protein